MNASSTLSHAFFIWGAPDNISSEGRRAEPSLTVSARSLSTDRWYKKTREQLAIDEFEVVDDFTIPGEMVTPRVIEQRDRKENIISVIHEMAIDGLSWGLDYSAKIDADTALVAASFLSLLGSSLILPKVAPDGEGGLVMIWENRNATTLLTVDNWKLHMVMDAGLPQARYIDGVHFDGKIIPSEILTAIPRQ